MCLCNDYDFKAETWSDFKHLIKIKRNRVYPEQLKIRLKISDEALYKHMNSIMLLLRENPKKYMVGFRGRSNTDYFELTSLENIRKGIENSAEVHNVGVNSKGNYYIDNNEYFDFNSFESNFHSFIGTLKRIKKSNSKVTIIFKGADSATFKTVYDLNAYIHNTVVETNKVLKEMNNPSMEIIHLTQALIFITQSSLSYVKLEADYCTFL